MIRGFIKSLIRFFVVPKGDSDVRVVYDGTSSGFNHWVWAPSFGLPTIESMLRLVDHQTWLGDLDIGEMFLNFPLHELAQIYAGVDLTPYFPEDIEKGKGKLWLRWSRCLVGRKPSPYQSIRTMLWAEDILRGRRDDEKNPFRWAYVRLNLPGSKDYDPSIPWIAKFRRDGNLASEYYIYVDDVCVTGASEEDVWEALRRISSIFGYLGIKDGASKTRPPTRRPGAWAGSMAYVDGNNVGVYIDHVKWTKTKTHIVWLREQVNICEGPANVGTGSYVGIGHKELERKRGFLLFTDNTVAESCFFKGTSNSRLLFNLVLRLRKAELNAGIKLHVVHVAGTRMIAQGTDGLSRGNLIYGVMAGHDILSFVPLQLSAWDRIKGRKRWLK